MSFLLKFLFPANTGDPLPPVVKAEVSSNLLLAMFHEGATKGDQFNLVDEDGDVVGWLDRRPWHKDELQRFADFL